MTSSAVLQHQMATFSVIDERHVDRRRSTLRDWRTPDTRTHRGIAFIHQGEEAAARHMHHPIGHGHLAGQDEGHRTRGIRREWRGRRMPRGFRLSTSAAANLHRRRPSRRAALNSLAVPCSMKSRAVTISSTAKAWGAYLLRVSKTIPPLACCLRSRSFRPCGQSISRIETGGGLQRAERPALALLGADQDPFGDDDLFGVLDPADGFREHRAEIGFHMLSRG